MNSARSVTAILMGDPRPDREAVSERRRAQLRIDEEPGPTPGVVEVLEALADGPMTYAELAGDLGMSLAGLTARAAIAIKDGLVGRTCGRPARLFLTPEGEALIR